MNILSLTFGPIGDTLMLLAWFDDVLKLDPDARMTIIATRNASLIRQLASGYPGIRTVEQPGLFGLPKFLALAFGRPWKVFSPGVAGVYSMHLKLFFLALSWRPGNTTVGMGALNGAKRWLPFNHVLPFDRSELVIDNFRRAIPIFFPEATAPYKRPPHVRIAVELPAAFAYAPGSYIVLHPISLNARRSLPPRRWPVLLRQLREQHPHLPILVTGAMQDKEAVEAMIRGIPGTEAVLGLPILQVAGIVQNAALYIGVDTGITHLASVMGQEVVMIGNRSNPTWWPAYNPRATILYNDERCLCVGDKGKQCSVEEGGQLYYRCVYDISDEQILTTVAKSLSARPS